SVRMEDEVVYRAALDEDLSVVWRKPVEIVDRPVAGQHVVVLTLYCKLLAAHGHYLRGAAHNPEVSRFFLGQQLQVQAADQFLSARVRTHLRRGMQTCQRGQSDCYHNREAVHLTLVPSDDRKSPSTVPA